MTFYENHFSCRSEAAPATSSSSASQWVIIIKCVKCILSSCMCIIIIISSYSYIIIFIIGCKHGYEQHRERGRSKDGTLDIWTVGHLQVGESRYLQKWDRKILSSKFYTVDVYMNTLINWGWSKVYLIWFESCFYSLEAKTKKAKEDFATELRKVKQFKIVIAWWGWWCLIACWRLWWWQLCLRWW